MLSEDIRQNASLINWRHQDLTVIDGLSHEFEFKGVHKGWEN